MIWLLACTSESPPVAPDPALGAAAAARSAAQVRAEGAADALTETMKATLMDAMKQGPAAAVAACADQAQGAAALALVAFFAPRQKIYPADHPAPRTAKPAALIMLGPCRATNLFAFIALPGPKGFANTVGTPTCDSISATMPGI